MKFIDEATITVQSGNGGSGCVSFRRERFIPKGGPDGGDGGRGGDVYLKTAAGRRTLYTFRTKKRFKAGNGQSGQGSGKTGRSGEDIFIELPPGTIVSDEETGEIITDLTGPNEIFLLLKGGRGGKGNTHFKSSTHRTPRFAQPGEPGTTQTLKLELKLLADVGLVGLPNAGKSTLISVISSARPKIGNYPFTTLTPSLGVVRRGAAEPFVVADIPGLIEGAHLGTGLGTTFLRHIERTRILVHLIDVSELDESDPLSGFRTVNGELLSHNDDLARKPQIVVLNKMDLTGAEEAAEKFCSAFGKGRIFRVSAATGRGVNELLTHIAGILDQLNATNG